MTTETITTSMYQLVIEGDIIKSDKNFRWYPGDRFYVPDSLGLVQKYKTFIWEGSEHDKFLLATNKVYRTPLDAVKRYEHELMVQQSLDSAE